MILLSRMIFRSSKSSTWNNSISANWSKSKARLTNWNRDYRVIIRDR